MGSPAGFRPGSRQREFVLNIQMKIGFGIPFNQLVRIRLPRRKTHHDDSQESGFFVDVLYLGKIFVGPDRVQPD